MIKSFGLRMMVWIIFGYTLGIMCKSFGGNVLHSILVFIIIAPIVSILIDPHSHNWFKKKFLNNGTRSE